MIRKSALVLALAALAFATLAPAQSGGAQPAAGQTAQPAKAATPAPRSPYAPPAQKPSTPVKPSSAVKPPTPAPAQAKPPAPQRPPVAAATPGQAGYSYRSEGRRDPFVSLWNPGTGVRQRSRIEGLAGVYTIDLLVKGILQSKGKFLAIVLGPDAKRQYILHTNDRLADGVVKAITADSVLILQEVSDPLSLAKQREVRKTLRAVEEVK